MKKRSEAGDVAPSLRDKIIGLGERSIRKSYYPQLLRQLQETERSRNSLAESEARYRRIVDTATEGIWMLDENFVTTFVNASMAGMLGYTGEAMIGRPFTDFLFDEDIPDHLRRMEKRKQGLSEHYERRFRCRDGHTVWTLASATPVLDDADRFCGSFAMFTDITARKQAEEEIRRFSQELEQRVADRTSELEAANKELEAFSYSVSHDLRAPLRAIDGFSGILLEDFGDKLDAEGKRLLKAVRDNTRRMGQLIDDILKFSRAGRTEIASSDVDMERLVRDAIEELAPAAGKALIDVGPLPHARGDAAMLRQVVVNLLSNAIKFSRPREAPVIAVSGSMEGNEAVYCVKDNGVGFDNAYGGKLFGVFQRLHSTAEFEGTGIGLAIVKRIVNRHGGRVWADGKIGEGATIGFTLPPA